MVTDELHVPDAFKTGMRRLAAGVSLITSQLDERRVGLIATAVSSVVADPPTLLVCINQGASAHADILAAGIFAVNVLAASDQGMAQVFSDPSRRHERFQTGVWDRAVTGAPLLGSAIVAFDCAVVRQIPYTTHTIFLGEVRAVRTAGSTCDPLVYLNQQFRRVAAL
ncbi:MAG: flavin reductase [Pseudacidovorax sp.]|uniref:flavin reductase family protein n=1 Tax=Pseudacidovorax sp. TaxID=1934311 RepID=UPI001B59FD34|nr:flavin reductase family protein [Pseudacidovorax sp.]MBP6895965.1 flavin reductase [Pseudacidovorax sp.]